MVTTVQRTEPHDAAPVSEPSPGSPSAPSTFRRRVLFDVARLTAAYAIIWLHTPQSEALGQTIILARFAVPFFVFATIFFVFDSLHRKPDFGFGKYVSSRVIRLYIPFLAWCGIYLAFKMVKKVLLPGQPNDFPGIEFLWTGSFYHLWFMPFIMIVSIVAFPFARLCARGATTAFVIGIGSLVLGITLAIVPLSVTSYPATSEYSMLVYNALPAVLMGLALAATFRWTKRLLEHRGMILAGVALFTVSTAILCLLGRERIWETMAGLGFFIIALSPLTTPWLNRVARLGALAYGIYLSHYLFIKVAEAIGSKIGLHTSWQLDVGIFLFAATGSTLLAWGLSRWNRTRWLVA